MNCLRAQSISEHANNKYFRTISVDEGLSQGTIFTVTQDSLGFIWAGTQNGLNRYDGKSFKVYRPVKGNANSIQSITIRSLFVDKEGLLWIGGDNGLCVYNHKKETFKNYVVPKKPGEWFITGITADEKNNIWISTSTGDIFYKDQATDKMLSYDINLQSLSVTAIRELLFIDKDLFVASDRGIVRINTASKKAEIFHADFLHTSCNCMFLEKNKLWVGTEGSGLFCFDLTINTMTKYVHEPGNAKGLINDNVRSIASDQPGNIWIGTFGGLSILDVNQYTFNNFEHRSTTSYSIGQNSVRCILRDRQNGMWLGTYYAGLSYYHKDDIKFNILNQHTEPVALSDQVINVINEDAEQNIWIGTNDKGLDCWNRKTNSIVHYTYKESDPRSISEGNIKAIVFDGSGNVFIGTHNSGLNILNKRTGQIRKYVADPKNPNAIAGNMVYALLADSKHRIWVGTRTGFDRYDADKNTFIHYVTDNAGKKLSSDVVTSLLEDQRGRIWVGTVNGVNILTPETGTFEVYDGSTLSEGFVTCMSQDVNGRIWIGTRSGLNYFDDQQKKIVHYAGLANDIEGMIYGIQPDNDHNIWVSTARGLFKLDDELKKQQLYNKQAGMATTPPAFCKTSDGMLLFSGQNGILYFYPRSIEQKPLDLKVTFTGLEVFNNTVAPGDDYGILSQPIDQAKSLNLRHDYTQFTIFFNAFNYISPGTTKYFYKLEGFDNDWQVCENIPKATYTNLKPGHYTLQVKAEGPLGEESPVSSIEINAIPPWWRSNWFYLLTSLVLAAAGYATYRVISEQIKAKQVLTREREERQKSEYLTQVKMDFFTNISHEFKTPLTLIIAPLEEMLNGTVTEKKLRKYHERMLMNAKRLYHLVDQVIEFRKTEKDVKKLGLTHGDIVNFVQDIYASFLEFSTQKNIKYSFKSTETCLLCYFDRDAIEKICTNLLSNALKYTPAGKEIEVSLTTRNQQLEITVRDFGIGIASVDLERVFERFYQVNSKDGNLGSGVGLALTKRLIELHHGTISVDSEPNNGTAFVVTIPLDREQYDQEEFAMQELEDPYPVAGDIAADEVESTESGNNDEEDEREHLLIVDDNVEIVDYLSDYFGPQYRISRAFNGSEAMKVLETEPVDVIISDVMMPETDGIQFCKKVKQNIATCHIPVILLTAKNETSSQIKGLEVGADDYVTKPFSIPVLDAKIKNIIRSRRRLKEYYSTATEIIPENIALNTLDEEFLRKAIEIIEEGLNDQAFSVTTFGRKIGMSRSSLYLKLKAITGESTTDFIKRIKFKKAAELLESRKYTITEVAYMSGFSSLSYFSTSFKQYYGYLPTEHLTNKQSK
jgi:signal transduction histidine kinase/ligand-binding sensor domain-containing protein/DNA-binding response OmpR family regulator